MNPVLKRSIRKTYSIAIALILTAMAVSGCGVAPQVSVSPVAAATQPANTQAPPPAPTGSLPNSDLFGIPASSSNALLGQYAGTLFKRSLDGGATSEQPFTATVHTVSLSPQHPPYAALSFRSSGAIGEFAFESYLNIGLAGYPANGVTAYGFSTSAQRLPELIDGPFTLHLILSLKDGVFSNDPTHSAIFIKECGFSQGAACSNFAQDVWFGSDLRKQSP